jgi:two-component system sensor histidine kinase DesK
MSITAPLWARRGPRPWTLLISIPVCLSLLIVPLSDPTPGPRSVSGWLGVAAAAVLFIAVVVTRYRGRTGTDRPAHLLLALLLVLAVGTTLAWSPAWSSLFLLLVVGVGMVVVDRRGPVVITAIALLAVAVDLVAGAATDEALISGLTTVLTGLGSYAVNQLFATVAQLQRARTELARLAVAEERDRFARDLHDLLGHTLSVIVVKAEVVRRLAPRDGEAAAAHAADIESIGREALTDLRRAASGYRGAGLDRELTRARPALEAAGVTLTLPGPAPGDALPEEVDVLLGWVVREGVTNVVRHARAKHCTVDVRRNGGAVRLTIEDDGTTAGPQLGTGAGLLGLTERVTAAGGTLAAAPTERGFRIVVDVPLSESPNEPSNGSPTRDQNGPLAGPLSEVGSGCSDC